MSTFRINIFATLAAAALTLSAGLAAPVPVQQAYLKASTAGSSNRFGFSVAVSGDTMVIGAPRESSNATGVNGNQSDRTAPQAGAAYVFVRSGTNWVQQAYLKASNTESFDNFGSSVAVSGDIIVVGASEEDSNAIGVNGNQNDNSAWASGAAYVFVRSGTNWTQQAYLKASDTRAGTEFGFSTAVSDDTVAVTGGGTAYIYVRTGTIWSQQAYLKSSNPAAGFNAIAVSGDTLVVGAPGEASNATGVNGNQSDQSLLYSGAAYIFVRSGLTWSQQAYLKASNTGDGDVFGYSVAASGDTVVVGAPHERSNATGVNGNQSDNSATFSGAAYIFVRRGANWSQQAYLKASNTEADDVFGWSVGVSGDTIVVGASQEDSNATGVNGNQNDNSASNSGAAYLFTRSGTNWIQQAYLKASNTGSRDIFGRAVAVAGGTVVVGAYGEDSNATGVNGNQSDDSAERSGAAYVFSLTSPNESPMAVAQAFPVVVISTNNSDAVVISPNNLNAVVILDGSLSSDPEDDPLEYFWFVKGAVTPFATGVRVTNVLAVGTYTFVVQVSDGMNVGTDTITVEVITAGEAVEELVSVVEGADVSRKNKRALIATLKAAVASFERNQFPAAINQLQAFQNKVRAQIAPIAGDLAAEWVRIAQEIIDAVAE